MTRKNVRVGFTAAEKTELCKAVTRPTMRFVDDLRPKLPPFSGRVPSRYGDYYEEITVH